MSSTGSDAARGDSSSRTPEAPRRGSSGASPPGPWTWRHVVPRRPAGLSPERQPRGEALVAADGTWVLWAQEGYARLEVANAATRALLADACQLPRLRTHVRDREQTCAQAVRGLQAELLEARRWAWYQRHRSEPLDTDPPGDPPAWLTGSQPPAASAAESRRSSRSDPP